MNKQQLSERDICSKFITPALQQAGWNLQTQVREEFSLTKGRIIVRGKLHTRAQHKRADYVLFYKANLPIAVIEAKDNKHSLGDGMQQALGYAELLQVPFVFSSNGDGFLFHNKLTDNGQLESELMLDAFPSPETLWQWWSQSKGLTEPQQQIVTQDYYSDGSDRTPRYYQLMAINKTIEAIAQGQNRLLLVMATGTGKTYTAFQIIWRLWKSGTKKRILFLADRNILVDQTKNNDFKPFGAAMTKITHRKVDKSYEIYLSLYQAVTGSEEADNIYKQFSPNFFDLIVVDECHRGSAAEDSAWRQILEYFSTATQIGLTATPKETNEVSNIDYFGEPVYSYSLKQGIDDGFLAPYKVVRIDLDKDLAGWRPSSGMTDKHGELIEDRIYNQKDFDKTLILEQRTKVVAQKVSEFLKKTNRFDKTIVFCENIDHAERMRQALVNENADLVKQNSKYIMRITGDNEEGKNELGNIIDPQQRYPVIAVTSKLMTTGVDAQTCKLIVLDQRIQSMTEFKQIVGRGTRINEEYNKFYFTIIDFKKATELFADPDFDGDPVQIYVPNTPEDPIVPPDNDEQADTSEDGETIYPMDDNPPVFPPFEETTVEDDKTPRKRYVVANVPVTVVAERVQYFDANGKLITESLKDYTRKTLAKEFASMDDFLRRWNSTDKKQAIIDELTSEGVFFDALAEEIGKDLDPFDLICHIAYDQPPLTRKERAEAVKKRNYFTQYGEAAQAVLSALLDKYADEGVTHIEKPQILTIAPFPQFGTPMEIVKTFGGMAQYQQAVQQLEQQLYAG